MAVTFARVGATPHLLRYAVTQDGGGGTTAQKTQAELIADCAPGPLREAVRAANWTNLNTNMTIQNNDPGGKIGINVFGRSGADAGLRTIFVAAPNIMQVTAEAAASVTILELSYRHSIAG